MNYFPIRSLAPGTGQVGYGSSTIPSATIGVAEMLGTTSEMLDAFSKDP